MGDIYRCRVCGSVNSKNLGSLPKQTHFAGRLLEKSLPDSFLYECNNCLLLVRHPVMSISQYNSLYEHANSEVWSSSDAILRYDQTVVRNFILKLNIPNCRVLDVGCYTAELLASLPEGFVKYGIEMSNDAASVATKKGIKIVGSDLYNIVSSEKFDIVTAVDVIEHTHNPEEFIQKLMSLLAPDGYLIVSTGNTDSWLWKTLKNRFWYSKFPEHISFIGDTWLKNFCDNYNFKIVDKHFFSYVPTDHTTVLKNMVKCIFSIMHIKSEKLSNTTKDHFCFIMRKKTLLQSEEINL